MKREEVIKLLEALTIEEIKSLKIVYYAEKNYSSYDTRTTNTLTINEEN